MKQHAYLYRTPAKTQQLKLNKLYTFIFNSCSISAACGTGTQATSPSYRVQQLLPHLCCAPALRLQVDSLSGRHPLVAYCGCSPGGQELVS